MKTLFVSGTDTEVGKTWVSSHLLRTLRESGRRVGAWKPVCSGAVERHGQQTWEDIDSLAAAVSGAHSSDDPPYDHKLTDRICNQRFDRPLAPNMAARLEDRIVSDEILQAGPLAWEDHADFVVVEGAGGLLSPASDTMLGADLAKHLNTPILLVAANRLGTIHQTLATIEAANARGLTIAGVILNEVSPVDSETLKSANESELRRLLPNIWLLVTPYDSPEPLRNAVLNIESWFA